MKKYKVCDLETNENVFGGTLSETNCYICAYPSVPKGNKLIRDLEVGESTLARYALSGSRKTYRVERTA